MIGGDSRVEIEWEVGDRAEGIVRVVVDISRGREERVVVTEKVDIRVDEQRASEIGGSLRDKRSDWCEHSRSDLARRYVERSSATSAK